MEERIMNVSFSLPAIGNTAMTSAEQRTMINQQVTAAIVCAYLEHMNATIEKGPALPLNPQFQTSSNILSPQELMGLIDAVQSAVGGIG